MERRIYDRSYRNNLRNTRYVADLSREPFGLRALRRWGNSHASGTTLDTLISYPRAEFTRCDLRGADFKDVLTGYDFRAANFTLANLQEANLSGMDLQGALERAPNSTQV